MILSHASCIGCGSSVAHGAHQSWTKMHNHVPWHNYVPRLPATVFAVNSATIASMTLQWATTALEATAIHIENVLSCKAVAGTDITSNIVHPCASNTERLFRSESVCGLGEVHTAYVPILPPSLSRRRFPRCLYRKQSADVMIRNVTSKLPAEFRQILLTEMPNLETKTR